MYAFAAHVKMYMQLRFKLPCAYTKADMISRVQSYLSQVVHVHCGHLKVKVREAQLLQQMQCRAAH